MPTIITRGLGRGGGGVTQRIIGDRLYGELTVLDQMTGILEEEDASPIGSIGDPIFVTGMVQVEEKLFGQLASIDVLQGFLQEESVTMSDVRINMYLGDDRTLALTVSYDPIVGTPVNLAGAKLWFTVKSKLTDTDADAVIQKRNTAAGGSDAEIKIIDEAGGDAEIYLVPEDTVPEDAAPVAPGIYVFDVQAILSGGKTYTVLRGRISFKKGATEAKT